MIDERRLHCTDEEHMQPIISGDGLEIRIGSRGIDSEVLVNGEPLPGVCGLRLEVRAGMDPPKLTLDLIEVGKRGAAQHRFFGHFITSEDYAAFMAWKDAR